jgi:hypothetical protein
MMGDLRPPPKRWENKLHVAHLPKHMIEGLGMCLAIDWESFFLKCSERDFFCGKWPEF